MLNMMQNGCQVACSAGVALDGSWIPELRLSHLGDGPSASVALQSYYLFGILKTVRVFRGRAKAA